MLAILGAGPHGRQIAALNPCSKLYDDNVDGFDNCFDGANLYPYVIGAAMPKVRIHIHSKLGWRATAHDDGRVIFPNAFISYDARLGEHVHVLPGAVVSHGCQVGDFVTIASNATLCGEVTVESGAFIGAGSTIRHGGITIGRNAIVGMGAVVVDDVPDGVKVVGNPAKPLVLL